VFVPHHLGIRAKSCSFSLLPQNSGFHKILFSSLKLSQNPKILDLENQREGEIQKNSLFITLYSRFTVHTHCSCDIVHAHCLRFIVYAALFTAERNRSSESVSGPFGVRFEFRLKR